MFKLARFLASIAFPGILTISSGCSSYVTPGRGVSIGSLVKVDEDIAERMKREPRAEFPCRIGVVRVQDSGYRSYHCEGYGSGRYSVVTTRDIETDADWARLEKLSRVGGIAPLNRLVIPVNLQSDRDLRLAAASVKADM